MEHSPSRRNQLDYYYHSGQPSPRPTDMAMLTATPAPHAGFQKEYPWDPVRYPTYPPQPSHGPAPGTVSLPSIRHVSSQCHRSVSLAALPY